MLAALVGTALVFVTGIGVPLGMLVSQDLMRYQRMLGFAHHWFGKIVMFVVVIFLFLHANPLLAVLALFVAFDLMRRSSVATGIDALQKFAPSEEKRTSQFTAYNQFPYTLEQEVVAKMAPMVSAGSSLTQASYKPMLDNLYDASPVTKMN
jgi:fumarate reductase subunit D